MDNILDGYVWFGLLKNQVDVLCNFSFTIEVNKSMFKIIWCRGIASNCFKRYVLIGSGVAYQNIFG